MGMKSADEVETNVAAAAAAGDVPVEIWTDAQAQGLIRSDVTVPTE